jgi:hypothetical protein
MAGICCVSPEYRRRGLFGEVEMRSIRAAGPPREVRRFLNTGRMAHPASFRFMSRSPAVVPKRGETPTAWQQAVGAAIAEAYGVEEFDPLTFVVKGSGVPIGYPVMDVDATTEEWGMFRHVDRSRGDSLLGIAWAPDPPEGW